MLSGILFPISYHRALPLAQKNWLVGNKQKQESHLLFSHFNLETGSVISQKFPKYGPNVSEIHLLQLTIREALNPLGSLYDASIYRQKWTDAFSLCMKLYICRKHISIHVNFPLFRILLSTISQLTTGKVIGET